ncbi:nitrate reductase molybdenum cofactor assembly chaperone [Streptomyces bullii]|uniref:Nitrate reductase molybdenum cofactor assembly chaperone n=1 Tax=Streptomyces bullii TaxID=349910 RepID=A0ABW0UQE4_9ACTN
MPGFEVLYQSAALCLMYPGEDFRARLPLLREAAPQLREFLDHAAVTPAPELAAHYLRVFGDENRHRLYLSWWHVGDSWQRGKELSRFQELYRAHGLRFSDEEPADFLPGVLEFTARTGDTELLTAYRDALDQLRTRLAALGTPYASVLDAVRATLPAARAGG